MPIPATPGIIPMPFAQNGQKNTIPEQAGTTTDPAASWIAGFPPITMVNKQAGGKPPYGVVDFNGILFALSQHAFFTQSGCVYPWMGADEDSDFPGLNYLKGAHVLGSDGEEYVALKPSGPDVPASAGGFVGPVDPVGDESGYWRASATSGIPTGIICMWSGAVDQVPAGWALCDGENGTPDLRDKFIRACGTNAVGSMGGSWTHAHSISGSVGYTTLSVNEIPSHLHNIHLRYAQSGLGGGNSSAFGPNGGESIYPTVAAGGSGAHTHGLSVDVGDAYHLPEYYTLAFIMKL